MMTTNLHSPIEDHIATIRGQRVMLDADLAALYGVPTKALVQAVKRNIARFPDDFMFQLIASEWEELRSQSVTSKGGRGGRRYLPYAFTEHGGGLTYSKIEPIHWYRNMKLLRWKLRLRSSGYLMPCAP